MDTGSFKSLRAGDEVNSAAIHKNVTPEQEGIIGRISRWLIGCKHSSYVEPEAAPPPERSVSNQFDGSVLTTAIDAFFNRCEAQNLAKNTISFYHFRFLAFRKYLVGKGIDVPVEGITPRIIRDFIADERARVSEVTAQKSFIALRALFNFLVDEGDLSVNPMANIKTPRVKKKIVPTFTPAQIKMMLQACGKGFVGFRNRAIIWVLYDCGPRVSELCGIDSGDINWSKQTIQITGKGNKERIIPFGHGTKKALQAYIAARASVTTLQALFVTREGAAMDRQGIDRTVKACGEDAGITGVRVSPHTFRHSFAVNYIRNGGDVFSLQKILGHSSLEMTRRYTELAQSDVLAKHQLFSPGDSLEAA